MSETHYSVLGVTDTATKEEIKKAYRNLSMKHHPDKNNGNPESCAKFQKINEAYGILHDEQKRMEYDMMMKNPFGRMNAMNGSFNGAMEVPMEDILGSFFGMGGIPGMPPGMMFGGIPGMAFGRMGPGGHNVHIFRNGVHVNMADNLQKPSPIIKNITIDIAVALTGATVPVEIERWIIENTNKVFEKETIYVDIPSGIDDNEIMVLQGKGNVSTETCKGDIKLFFKVQNNTDFTRQGLDLIIEKKISLKDALCGFSFDLKYINGKNYTLNNNKGSIISPEYKKVIPNMGLKRDGKSGNLIVVFHVEFPTTLSEDKINKLSEIL